MKVKTIEKGDVKITIYRQYMVILQSPTQNRMIKGIGTLSEAEEAATEMMEEHGTT